MAKCIYTAEWVLPVTSPPIRHAAVVTDNDLLVFVGSRAAADIRPEFLDADRIDFGRAAILPGLVNTHSHLELTVMRGFLESLSFRNWILKLTTTKYERLTTADMQASALLGTAEAIRAGVTTLADTGDSRGAFDALLASGLRGIAYRECFGPDPATAERSLEELRTKVSEMREHETPSVRVGISPHAPYTVSGRLFELLTRYAGRESLDVCIHAAESQAEEDLLLRGAGEFADGLRSRGIHWRTPGLSTIRYFSSIGVLESAPLLVHCVRAGEEEIRLLVESGSRVAHCPKSNAKLGHGTAPLERMLAAGVTVGVGTDSVASNNRCDLIGEAQFCGLLHRATSKNYQFPAAETLLRLATIDGARALRLDHLIGSLEPGKQADLIALDLTGTANTPVHDPTAAIIFSASAGDIRHTVVAGQVLFDGKQVRTLDEADLKMRVNAASEKCPGTVV